MVKFMIIVNIILTIILSASLVVTFGLDTMGKNEVMICLLALIYVILNLVNNINQYNKYL